MDSQKRRFSRVVSLLAVVSALFAGAWGVASRGGVSAQDRLPGVPPVQPPPQAPPPIARQAAPQQAVDSPAVADAVRVGEAFIEVAERVSPSVVSIRVDVVRPPTETPFGFFGPGQQGNGDIVRGEGSGFIVSADGAILTNNHVVENANRIDVVLQDGRHFSGELVGTDTATDLAVIRIRANGLPVARLFSGTPRVGEWVVAIGSPFGLDYTVTTGVLSAVGRAGLGQNEIEDYLQTDASINPGNSGGPLVNLRGEVLGVNTMIVGRGTGIGFAVPSSIAKTVADQLLASGVVRRSWIGVGFQELTPELAASFGTQVRQGALISHVASDGPAARANLAPGDIVQSIEGHDVHDGRDLLRAILQYPVGARLRVGILRGSRQQTMTLTTTTRPGQDARTVPPVRMQRPASQPTWGLLLEELTPQVARRIGYTGAGRVVVGRVVEGSYADRAGIRPGDVIVEADRAQVATAAQIETALSDGSALLRVERRDNAFFTVISRE